MMLALLIYWRGTLQQYVGCLHRLHDNKREVVVYDCVDNAEPVLSKMCAMRERGHDAVDVVSAPL